MKNEPRYGYYPRWPENGNQWVHPEDVSLARKLIPSPRVFRADGREGPYVFLRYGELQLRVRPALWQEVVWEGFEVGGWVEILSAGMRNTPRIGVVREMLCHDVSQGLRYQITGAGHHIPNEYVAGDLRHAEPTPPLQD